MKVEESRVDELYVYLTAGLIEFRRASLSFAEDVAEAPAIHRQITAHFRYAEGEVARMLADGIDAGEFTMLHPILAAEVLDAGIVRLLDPNVLRSAGVSLSDALEEIFVLFVDGLRLP